MGMSGTPCQKRRLAGPVLGDRKTKIRFSIVGWLTAHRSTGDDQERVCGDAPAVSRAEPHPSQPASSLDLTGAKYLCFSLEAFIKSPGGS